MKPTHGSGSLLYEGKAKKVFASDQNEHVVVEFKDDATAFNALKRSVLKGKGYLNCQISAHLFNFLNQNKIPTHFLSLSGDNLMNAKLLKIIPLEVVVRNVATGSLCKETPIVEGKELTPPLMDLYYKDDDLGDPLLTNERLKLLELVSEGELSKIEKLARKVNDLLISFFKEIDIFLVDFKLEFGVDKLGEILVADEISPDTCRLWDQRCDDHEHRILDKDRFRKDLGGVIEGYGEILKRIQRGSNND